MPKNGWLKSSRQRQTGTSSAQSIGHVTEARLAGFGSTSRVNDDFLGTSGAGAPAESSTLPAASAPAVFGGPCRLEWRCRFPGGQDPARR